MQGSVTTLFGLAVAWSLISVFPGRALAQRAEITIEVTPDSGALSDTFTATVHVAVPGQRGPERYWAPEFEGFTVLDEQTHKTTLQQHEPGRGMVSVTSEEHRYVLQPAREGTLAIRGARIRVAGREYQAQPVAVKVQALPGPDPAPAPRDPTTISGIGAPGFESPSPPPDNSGDAPPEMFLHVAIHPRDAYVGEQITVTWLLYSRHELLKLEPSVPRLDDFWTEILYEPGAYFRYDKDVVRGISYRVLVVSKRALFATRPGELEIGPYTAGVSSLYSPLGHSTRLASEPVRVNIKPLPPGAPPGFDATYVGTFRVAAEVDQTHMDAGQSLTLTVTVRGQGAVRRTTAPKVQVPWFEFRAPRDFDETMHPSTKVVSGERTYRYWATPQRGGVQTISPITIHYFDPRSKTYEQARSQPIEITVAGDPAALASSARRVASARDIRLIRDGTSISSRIAPRLYQAPWFWAASALPLFLFMTVVLVKRVQRRSAGHGVRLARKRFHRAELHLRGDRAVLFFGELSRIIDACIEERFAEPVQSMTRDELGAFLAARGVPEALVARLRRELDQCDFARFAGTAVHAADMRSALDRVRALVRELTASHAGDSAQNSAGGRGRENRS